MVVSSIRRTTLVDYSSGTSPPRPAHAAGAAEREQTSEADQRKRARRFRQGFGVPLVPTAEVRRLRRAAARPQCRRCLRRRSEAAAGVCGDAAAAGACSVTGAAGVSISLGLSGLAPCSQASRLRRGGSCVWLCVTSAPGSTRETSASFMDSMLPGSASTAEHRRLRGVGDRQRLSFRIGELLSALFTRIVPVMKRGRGVGGCFAERDDRLVCRLVALGRYGKDGRVDLRPILGEHLNDVPVDLRVRELEQVAPGRQGDAWERHRRAERHDGILVGGRPAARRRE